jgi:hypothetical protein
MSRRKFDMKGDSSGVSSEKADFCLGARSWGVENSVY